MSDPIQSVAIRPTAAEIEDRAADFLMACRDHKNWTDADQKKLDAWLTASIRNEVAYFRLEAAVKRAERLRALKPSVSRPSRVWPAILKIAIAVSIIVTIGILGNVYVTQPRTTAYQTAIGNREILSLNDGSQIELNTDTSLRVSQRLTTRQAWLDKGEAYFQIKHDPRRPFVVIAGNSRITDLGTKFVLRRYSDRLEMVLLEGAARVDSADTDIAGSSAILKPGDAATVKSGSITIHPKTPQALTDELGWRRGVLTFRYATLAEAAQEFNRYNQSKIVITDPRISQLTIYGAFAANDAAAFADAAQIDFKLHVENRNGQIILTRQ